MDLSMPGSLVLHLSWSSLKLMSIESVMLSDHLMILTTEPQEKSGIYNAAVIKF